MQANTYDKTAIQENKTKRIVMLDSLRGFVLLGILLFHSVLKFQGGIELSDSYISVPVLDSFIKNIIVYIFSGKAYTLFSFFLGFSYYLQFSSRKKKGDDYSWRFIWRLAILLLFGFFNIAFYGGDILILYALTACILVIVRHWKNKYILVLSLFLLLSPIDWYYLIVKLLHLDQAGAFYQNLMTVVNEESHISNNFIESLKFNLTKGIKFNLGFYATEGRVFQAPGLFLAGYLAGRIKLLTNPKASYYNKAMAISLGTLLIIHIIRNYFLYHIENSEINEILFKNLTQIYNIPFAALIMFTFVRLWHIKFFSKILHVLSFYGKMSLTNYIMQSIFGSFIFYGFGLSMASISGSTICFVIALIIFGIQLAFSYYWSRKFTYGPFEYIWRRLTWLDFKNLKPSDKKD